MMVATETDVRSAVLDATERLLGRYGYQKMTMDDIAAEAGVGRRTIYLHFTGKQEVALSTIDRIVAAVHTELAQIARSRLCPEEKIKAMLRARVLIRVDRVHDYYRSLDEILSSLRPQFMERRRGYFAAEAAMFAEVLESGIRACVFGFDDALDTANVLLTATNSLLPHSLTVREMSEGLKIEERTNQVSEFLVKGLTNKGDKS